MDQGRRRASIPAPKPSPHSASTQRNAQNEEEEEPELHHPLLPCPPTARRRRRRTLHHLHQSTLPAWSSGQFIPRPRHPPRPPSVPTPSAPHLKPTTDQRHPNPQSRRETARKTARGASGRCRRAATRLFHQKGRGFCTLS